MKKSLVAPSLHRSIAPSLHRSIAPSLHRSIAPSLHCTVKKIIGNEPWFKKRPCF
ncbi:MAG: hypothetical protein K0B05_12235 [Bacteroidales bacterium]|nr:hypothetical protein [Bacteroidales bacterium]